MKIRILLVLISHIECSLHPLCLGTVYSSKMRSNSEGQRIDRGNLSFPQVPDRKFRTNLQSRSLKHKCAAHDINLAA